MFFSYNILIAKNSSFAVIWKYMHDRRGAYKVSKRDLQSIDIDKACEDLIGYVPTGELLKSELRNKMSLYLLAQLSYGITLVFSAQADYLIADLQAAIKSLIRLPEEEKREKQQRKSTARKRRATELDGIVEAAIAVPRGLEPEEMEDEEGDEDEERKRRRTSARKQSMLDLTDPRAYVDHQLPGRTGPEEQMLMEDSGRLDDMFMAQSGVQPQLPPAEWGPEQGTQRQSQKVSMGSILLGPDEESLLREVEQTVTVSNLSAIAEVQPLDIDGPGPELPVDGVEVMREPIYRKDTDESGKGAEDHELRDSMDQLHLDALPDLVQAPKAGPIKKRKRLLIDEQTSFTNEEFLNRMQNYQDIVRSRDQLLKEIAQPDLPPLSELLSPRPYHIKALNPELYPLFDSARADYRDRPLNFEEALRMTADDFRDRRMDFDARSWHSSSTIQSPAQEEQRQREVEESLQIEQDRRGTKDKVSMAEITLGEEPIDNSVTEKRPSSALEGEAMRRDTGDRRTDFSLEQQQPLVPFEEEGPIIMQQEPEQEQQRAELTADMELLQESLLSKEKASPPMVDEGWVDAEAHKVYNQIALVGVVPFKELFEKSKVTRAEVARKFFTLLTLLKGRKIKVRQRAPYAEILIRDLAHGQSQEQERNKENLDQSL